MRKLERVAFVVIGRDEGDRLRDCLGSIVVLSKQVVYADSASTDGSANLARSLGVEVVEITTGPWNAARGRNEGFARARNVFPGIEFVQFLDGDCMVAPEWPFTAASFLESHSEVAVVCGRRFEAHPERSFYNKLADTEWNTPVGETDACGGDSMMRIAALVQTGGFDSDLLAGEEPELCGRLRALGWTVWRLDAPMSKHDANMFTFGQWWRRTVRSGFGYAQVWQRGGQFSKPVVARQLMSALFWIVLLPAAIVVAAVILRLPMLLFAIPLAYAVQTLRVASRRGGHWGFRSRSSLLIMVGKAAELMGAVRSLLSPARSTPIEYK